MLHWDDLFESSWQPFKTGVDPVGMRKPRLGKVKWPAKVTQLVQRWGWGSRTDLPDGKPNAFKTLSSCFPMLPAFNILYPQVHARNKGTAIATLPSSILWESGSPTCLDISDHCLRTKGLGTSFFFFFFNKGFPGWQVGWLAGIKAQGLFAEQGAPSCQNTFP